MGHYVYSKNRIKLIVFISLFFILFSCVNATKEIYDKKGYNDPMKKRLKPIIIPASFPIYVIKEINIQNTLATVNNKGEFCTLTIDETDTIHMTPVAAGFPGKGWQTFHSDPVYNVLWMTRGRGVYALDMETKKTGHIIVSNNGNDSISTTYLMDHFNKYVYIEVLPPYPIDCYYILFDLLNDKEVINSKQYNGNLYPFQPDKFLFCEFVGKKNDKVSWKIIDKDFNNLEENKLTEKLTSLQIEVYPRSKAFNIEKRIMFGTARPMEKLTYFTIAWDEELEEVNIEPIILQRPENSMLDERVDISGDGSWMKTVVETRKGRFINPPELVIYHVGEMYPQHLSMPILCGYTKEGNDGAFMNHSEWGPCYVELDYEYKNKLFVYKLNDGLKILAEQAMELGGK